MTFALSIAFAISPILVLWGWFWFLWDKHAVIGPLVLLLIGGALLILATIFGE